MAELRTYIKTAGISVVTKVERIDALRVRIKYVKADSTSAASTILSNAELDDLLKQISAVTNANPAPLKNPIYWGARMDGEVYGGGDAPWDQATWNTFEAHAGRKASLVSFGQPAPWVQAFSSTPLNLCYARGAVPMMDMQIGTNTLAEIAAGVRDTEIIAWAKSVALYKRPFLYRWCHEMNGEWYGYGAEAAINPAIYVAAWRHWRDLCDNAGATNLTWVWCPNVIFTGSTDLRSLYPGNAYVDWLGMDGYNSNKPWTSPANVFSATYSALSTLNQSAPMVVCETGCTESGGDKAKWITDLYAALPLAFPRIRAVSWFNWNIIEGGVRKDWQIESSPAAQAAFAKAVQSSSYVANGFTATSGKVAPPNPV